MEHLASSKLTRAEVWTPVTPCRALHFRLSSVHGPDPFRCRRLPSAWSLAAAEPVSKMIHIPRTLLTYFAPTAVTQWELHALPGREISIRRLAPSQVGAYAEKNKLQPLFRRMLQATSNACTTCAWRTPATLTASTHARPDASQLAQQRLKVMRR